MHVDSLDMVVRVLLIGVLIILDERISIETFQSCWNNNYYALSVCEVFSKFAKIQQFNLGHKNSNRNSLVLQGSVKLLIFYLKTVQKFLKSPC
jgi:hypothetical protein